MCAAVTAAAAAPPPATPPTDASSSSSSLAPVGPRLPPAVVLFAWPPSPEFEQAAAPRGASGEGVRASHRASFDAAAPRPSHTAGPSLPPLPRAAVAYKPLRTSRLRDAIEEALRAGSGGEGGASAAPSLASEATTSPPVSTAGASAPPPPPRRRRALLVEDDKSVAKVVARMLEACGCEPTVARDGPSALAMLLQAHRGDPSPPSPPFDIVFMDLNLPGMDGDEVVAAARRDAPDATLPPIIAMSGEARWLSDEERAAAGFVDSLPKPFNLVALRAMLQRVVGAGGTSSMEE